ncbi:MAG: DHH family phosphoesterase [Candidatus Micrarchaeia archaeon]
MNGRIVYATLSTTPSYTLVTAAGLVETEESDGRREIGDWIDSETLEPCPADAAVEERLARESAPLAAGLLVDDEGMRSILPQIEEACRLLKRNVLETQPMLIRFHDDCDGISSALLLKKALESFAEKHDVPLRVSFKQAESAVYSRRELEDETTDTRAFPVKPLFVFLDHAANAESAPLLAELRESQYSILVIDHHPHAAPVNCDLLVSPHAGKGDSKHVTGLLCFEIARRIAGSPDERLAWWALQSDHSELRHGDNEIEPIALDYLSITSEKPRIEDYERTVADHSLLDYYYRKSKVQLERALENAKAKTRVKYANGLEFHLIDLNGLEKGAYPSKGKVINAYCREREEEDVVCLAYGDTTLLYRVTAGAHAKGFKANESIDALKKKHPEAVESGGGHERASSVRFRKGYANKIVDSAITTWEKHNA